MLLVFLLLHSPDVLAQPIERHVPERNEASPVEVAPPLIDPQVADDEPIGVELKGLVFLGPDDAVLPASAGGVDTSRVAQLDDPAFHALVADYLHQPLSRRLIAEIEAAVVEFYRDQGYPFVSVTTPPQEVTGGLLQVRVVEFHAGRISVTGEQRATLDHVLRRVRLAPGEEITAPQLSEDINWLNQNPFRTYVAIFTPGELPGETDLDLRVTETKPWQAFAGYANTGSEATGRDRYFVGATIADFPATDVLASYQLTGSRDFWYDDGDLFGNAGDPRFVSHGGFVSVPVAPRQELEIVASHVRTFEEGEFFDIAKRTTEGRIGHRSALSNFSRLPGDVSFGIEAKHQHRDIHFADVLVATNRIEVFQGFAGWADIWEHEQGRTSFDVRGYFSPGNLGALNSDEALAAMTAGRVSRARYGYARANFEHRHRLPRGFSFVVSASGQLASGPLPDTEQFGIVGANAVRGYVSEDGGYDWGGYVRNELRLPPLSNQPATDFPDFTVQPFVFFDAGYGANRDHAGRLTAASVGAGVEAAVAQHLSLDLSVGHALSNGDHTERGDTTIHARARIQY